MEYSDGLIDIDGEFIVLKKYYFPFGNSKRIPIGDVKAVRSAVPSVMNGKYRIWGTGWFDGWFPMDWKRPARDRIFMMSLKNSRFRIGFTVEDSGRVEAVFRKKGLLK